MRRARLTTMAGLGLAMLAAACGKTSQAQAPAAAPAATERPNPLPGITESMEQLEREMFHVSAGRRLKPASWPGNNRVAVALSFDVDNASMALSQGNLDYEVLSRGGRKSPARSTACHGSCVCSTTSRCRRRSSSRRSAPRSTRRWCPESRQTPVTGSDPRLDSRTAADPQRRGGRATAPHPVPRTAHQ